MNKLYKVNCVKSKSEENCLTHTAAERKLISKIIKKNIAASFLKRLREVGGHLGGGLFERDLTFVEIFIADLTLRARQLLR
jgi:hypothetical protein